MISNYSGSTSNIYYCISFIIVMLKYLYDFLMIKVCINKLKKLMNQKNKRSTSTENNYDKMRELRDYFNPEILQKCPITVLGKIEYRNLAFKYSDKNKTKVLNYVSLIKNPGQRLGFVGCPGSGKSTLI